MFFSYFLEFLEFKKSSELREFQILAAKRVLMTLVNLIECFMPRAVNSVGYSVINYFRSFLLSRFLFLSVETKMVLSCWAWWWRRKYPQAIFTLESQKSLELWKWAERNEDIRNWMEEGVLNFANFITVRSMFSNWCWKLGLWLVNIARALQVNMNL